MACIDDYIERKERYRLAVDELQKQLRQDRKFLDEDTLRRMHADIVGGDGGVHLAFTKTMPPYCDDRACRCWTIK